MSRSPRRHPRRAILGGCLLLAACGDPVAYPAYEADTGPDLELIDDGSDGSGGSGGGGGGLTLPTLDGACLTGASACSVGNGESSYIDLVNNSDRTVDLYWVDGGCALILYQTAAPGSTLSQQSYATHVWAVVDQETGTELGRVETTFPDRCEARVQ